MKVKETSGGESSCNEGKARPHWSAGDESVIMLIHLFVLMPHFQLLPSYTQIIIHNYRDTTVIVTTQPLSIVILMVVLLFISNPHHTRSGVNRNPTAP